MALGIANGNIITVRLLFDSLQTKTAINILHYRVTAMAGSDPGSNVGLSLIAQTIYTKFATTWAAIASEGVNFRYVTAWNTSPAPRSVGYSYVPSGGTPGAVEDSDPLPLQDTPTILKRTDVGQRWGLGRMFVTGLSENSQSEGVIAEGTVTGLVALANLVDDVVNVVGIGWNCELEPVLVRGPEAAPISVTRVTQAVLSNNVLKTQRRRRPGKGA